MERDYLVIDHYRQRKFVGKKDVSSVRATVEILHSRTSTVLDLVSGLSGGFRLTISLVLRTGNHIVLAKVKGSKRVTGGISTAVTDAKAPSFFLRPTRNVRKSLKVIATRSIIMTCSGDNRANRVLGVLPSLGEVNTGLVTIIKGARSALTRGTSIMLSTNILRRTSSLKLTPADSAATTLTLNSTLTITLVRGRGFATSGFTMFRPNKSLKGHLLVAIRVIVRRNDSGPMVGRATSIGSTLFIVAGVKLNTMSIISKGFGLGKLVASKSIHHKLRGRGSFLVLAVGRIVARGPLMVATSGLTTRTLRGVRGRIPRPVAILPMISGSKGSVNVIRIASLLERNII